MANNNNNMAEQNVRQRTKQLPSMEARSHRPIRLQPGSTNSSTRQSWEDTLLQVISNKGDKAEILGDGTDIHHGPREESNQRCRNSKAFGQDKLSIFHLKHLGPRAIEYITALFNVSVTTCQIPVIWKSSLIIPIPKPGKDTSVETSYRPISLLCTAAKVLVSLIMPTINTHLQPAPDQHGFRPVHSTTSALLQMTDRYRNGIQPEVATRSNDLRSCRFIGCV